MNIAYHVMQPVRTLGLLARVRLPDWLWVDEDGLPPVVTGLAFRDDGAVDPGIVTDQMV